MGHGSMREPLEFFTASLMQNMVLIRKKNTYFVIKLLLKMFGKNYFGALGVESPHGGAICFVNSIVDQLVLGKLLAEFVSLFAFFAKSTSISS